MKKIEMQRKLVQNACFGVVLHVRVLFWLSKHILVAVAHSRFKKLLVMECTTPCKPVLKLKFELLRPVTHPHATVCLPCYGSRALARV
jgi:hypothetical protein